VVLVAEVVLTVLLVPVVVVPVVLVPVVAVVTVVFVAVTSVAVVLVAVSVVVVTVAVVAVVLVTVLTHVPHVAGHCVSASCPKALAKPQEAPSFLHCVGSGFPLHVAGSDVVVVSGSVVLASVVSC
jgi:hypothetical protein